MDKSSVVSLRGTGLLLVSSLFLLLLVGLIFAIDSKNDSDGCYDETVVGACTSVQVDAINSSGGTTYTFNKNIGSPIRVSFKNEGDSIGTITDCQVYVVGYDGDGNGWTLQLGNWSTATWDDAGITQTISGVEATYNWTCTNHFGSANDEDLFDDFAVRIDTNDASGPATAYIDYVWVNITYSAGVTDTCSCPSGANWEINMTDHCNITIDCDINGYNLSFVSGSTTDMTNISAMIICDNFDINTTGIIHLDDSNAYINTS